MLPAFGLHKVRAFLATPKKNRFHAKIAPPCFQQVDLFSSDLANNSVFRVVGVPVRECNMFFSFCLLVSSREEFRPNYPHFVKPCLLRAASVILSLAAIITLCSFPLVGPCISWVDGPPEVVNLYFNPFPLGPKVDGFLLSIWIPLSIYPTHVTGSVLGFPTVEESATSRLEHRVYLCTTSTSAGWPRPSACASLSPPVCRRKHHDAILSYVPAQR